MWILVRPGGKIRPNHDHSSFANIRKAIAHVKEDCYFGVGSAIFRRQKGWAMGAPLSEPATLADLGECVHQLYINPQFAKHVGLS